MKPHCLYCEAGRLHVILVDTHAPSPASDFECNECGFIYHGVSDYARQRERKDAIEKCPPELPE